MSTRIYASVTKLANNFDGYLQADDLLMQLSDDVISIRFSGRIPKGEYSDVLRECRIDLPIPVARSFGPAITAVAMSDGVAVREIRVKV